MGRVTAWIDVLFNVLLGVTALFILAVLMINPIADTGRVTPPAEILITLTWPDEVNEDVDLYVEDPAGNLVWFRRMRAGIMHLERDDLGRPGDVLRIAGREIVNPVNQEVVALRGTMSGEYVVNAHLYRTEAPPVPVRVRVERVNPRFELLYVGDGVLMDRSHEITLVRFTLDVAGELVDVSDLPKALTPLRRSSSGWP